MGDYIISGLYIYPVKSLAGIPLQESAVDRFGLAYDRRWMLVDAEGRFFSQRQQPRMALIQQRILNDKLVLQVAGQTHLSLPLNPSGGKQVRVKVWGESCDAWYCGAEAEVWLSGFLEYPCRLVYMPTSDGSIWRMLGQKTGPHFLMDSLCC